MRPEARRILAVVAAVVLLAVAVVLSRHHDATDPAPTATPCVDGPRVAVRGLVGSEKESLFRDPAVIARFACVGLDVTVDLAGSRDMVDRLGRDRAGYAFAFPGSTAAAEKIEQELSVHEVFTPFSSPMAVATFRPIVDVLTRAGVVSPGADGEPALDIAALLGLVRRGTTWDQLPGNTAYRVHKTVLLSTTDPQDSNSAIMFLSIASNAANGGAVVTNQAQIDRVLPDLCRLVAYQGDKPETSQVLFNYYLTDGMGRIPMGLIYEAQYLSRASGQAPVLTPDRTLLYPRPTVYSRHTVVPLDDGGRRVGQLLHDDPELLRLIVEHGFRPERPVDQPVGATRTPGDVVESPSFDVVEKMIDGLRPDRCLP